MPLPLEIHTLKRCIQTQFEIGVVENNHRCFPTEFQSSCFQVFCPQPERQLTHVSTPGYRHSGYSGVC